MATTAQQQQPATSSSQQQIDADTIIVVEGEGGTTTTKLQDDELRFDPTPRRNHHNNTHSSDATSNNHGEEDPLLLLRRNQGRQDSLIGEFTPQQHHHHHQQQQHNTLLSDRDPIAYNSNGGNSGSGVNPTTISRSPDCKSVGNRSSSATSPNPLKDGPTASSSSWTVFSSDTRSNATPTNRQSMMNELSRQTSLSTAWFGSGHFTASRQNTTDLMVSRQESAQFVPPPAASTTSAGSTTSPRNNQAKPTAMDSGSLFGGPPENSSSTPPQVEGSGTFVRSQEPSGTFYPLPPPDLTTTAAPTPLCQSHQFAVPAPHHGGSNNNNSSGNFLNVPSSAFGGGGRSPSSHHGDDDSDMPLMRSNTQIIEDTMREAEALMMQRSTSPNKSNKPTPTNNNIATVVPSPFLALQTESSHGSLQREDSGAPTDDLIAIGQHHHPKNEEEEDNALPQAVVDALAAAAADGPPLSMQKEQQSLVRDVSGSSAETMGGSSTSAPIPMHYRPKINDDEDSDISHNLFVVGLLQQVTSEQFRKMFEPFGPIVSATVKVDMVTGNSLGYGFVRYKNESDSERALKAMNKVRLGPNTLHVSRSHHHGAVAQSNAIFLRNFPTSLGQDESRRMFERFGEIVAIKRTIDRTPLPPSKSKLTPTEVSNQALPVPTGPNVVQGENIISRANITVEYKDRKQAEEALKNLSGVKHFVIPALTLKVVPAHDATPEAVHDVNTLAPALEMEREKIVALSAPLLVKFAETTKHRRDRQLRVAQNELRPQNQRSGTSSYSRRLQTKEAAAEPTVTSQWGPANGTGSGGLAPTAVPFVPRGVNPPGYLPPAINNLLVGPTGGGQPGAGASAYNPTPTPSSLFVQQQQQQQQPLHGGPPLYNNNSAASALLPFSLHQVPPPPSTTNMVLAWQQQQQAQQQQHMMMMNQHQFHQQQQQRHQHQQHQGSNNTFFRNVNNSNTSGNSGGGGRNNVNTKQQQHRDVSEGW